MDKEVNITLNIDSKPIARALILNNLINQAVTDNSIKLVGDYKINIKAGTIPNVYIELLNQLRKQGVDI